MKRLALLFSAAVLLTTSAAYAQTSNRSPLAAYLKPVIGMDRPIIVTTPRPTVSRETYVNTARQVTETTVNTASNVAALRLQGNSRAALAVAVGGPIVAPVAGYVAGAAAGHRYDQSGGSWYSAPRSQSVRTTTPYAYVPPTRR